MKWAPLKLTMIALPRSRRLLLDIRDRSYPKSRPRKICDRAQTRGVRGAVRPVAGGDRAALCRPPLAPVNCRLCAPERISGGNGSGPPAEARALLTPIYGWFTEGLDTVDLQQ